MVALWETPCMVLSGTATHVVSVGKKGCPIRQRMLSVQATRGTRPLSVQATSTPRLGSTARGKRSEGPHGMNVDLYMLHLEPQDFHSFSPTESEVVLELQNRRLNSRFPSLEDEERAPASASPSRLLSHQTSIVPSRPFLPYGRGLED
jgi:hypothetical protein